MTSRGVPVGPLGPLGPSSSGSGSVTESTWARPAPSGSSQVRQSARSLWPSSGLVFGISSTVGDDDPRLDARTLVPSYVCFATWPMMVEVFGQYPQVMLKVMGALSEQVCRAESWRERLGMGSPRPAWQPSWSSCATSSRSPGGDGEPLRC